MERNYVYICPSTVYGYVRRVFAVQIHCISEANIVLFAFGLFDIFNFLVTVQIQMLHQNQKSSTF